MPLGSFEAASDVSFAPSLPPSLSPSAPLWVQEGYTTLMLAAEKEEAEAVKALLQAGAATDLKNKVCPPFPGCVSHWTQRRYPLIDTEINSHKLVPQNHGFQDFSSS